MYTHTNAANHCCLHTCTIDSYNYIAANIDYDSSLNKTPAVESLAGSSAFSSPLMNTLVIFFIIIIIIVIIIIIISTIITWIEIHPYTDEAQS